MIDESCTHADARGAWVLGALPPDEAAEYADHLTGCRACQDEVAAAQRSADAVLAGVPDVAAPPSLERRVLAAVSHVRPAAEVPAPAKRSRAWGRVAALAAAAAVLAAVTFAVGRSTAPEPDRAVVERRLPVTETAAQATLRERDGAAELVLEQLGPPPRGRVYQLWLRYPRRPLAATNRLFSVSDEGTAVVAVPRLGNAEEIVVTAEPPRGSRSPSLPPVLVAGLGDG